MAAAGPDLSQCQGRTRSQEGWKAHGKHRRRVMEMVDLCFEVGLKRARNQVVAEAEGKKVGGFGYEGAPISVAAE